MTPTDIEKKGREFADNLDTSRMSMEWLAAYRGYLAGASDVYIEKNKLIKELEKQIESIKIK